MELREAIEIIEESEEFKDWKKTHEKWYLVHGFLIDDENPEWQVGFSDGSKVVTFMLNPVKAMPEQEAYKKDETKIKELDKDSLILSLDDAKVLFNEVIQEKYSAELVTKTIILVQNLGNSMYNITGLTQSLKALNIRIGMDGKVIEDTLQPLISQ